MIRLLQIEWFKLRHYRPFWVLIGLYAFLATALCSCLMFFMNFLKNEGADFNGFDPTMLPLYDFPDIWLNIAFLASITKVLLAFIVVMSIFNEINSRIIRQNVIDGMSKREWLISKLFFIAAIAASASALLFINGLILGLIYGHPDGLAAIFDKSYFILIYFLDVFTYLTFAMMLTLLIRKGGIVIVGLLMYTMMLEPFASVFLYTYPHLADFWRFLPDFFPVQSSRNMMLFPFKRYMFSEIQDVVPFRTLSIVFAWVVFNASMSYFLLTKRDI